MLSTFTVVNTDDFGTGSLREAIDLANGQPGADTIAFARSARGEIELSASLGELLITDDLTIDGPGQHKLTVSGEGVTRVFRVVPDVTVSFQKLTIANGLATDAPDSPLPEMAAGGGILARGATLLLDRVSMTGNRAEGASVAVGGAVDLSPYGSLTVTRSSFSDNVATGGSVAAGGAVTCDLAALEVGLSSFSYNAAVSLEREALDPQVYWYAGIAGLGSGGAIFSIAAPATVDHSLFIGNEAVGGNGVGGNDGGNATGGAITASDLAPLGPADGTLEVTHSTFKGNSARGGDGGPNGGAGGLGSGGGVAMEIQLFGNTGALRHSIFRHNLAVGGAGGDNGGQGGAGVGGGIASNSGAAPDVQYVTLLHNEARGGEGGSGGGSGGDGRGGGIGMALSDIPGFEFLVPSVTVLHSRIVGNVAVGGNGGDGGGTGGSGLGGGLASVSGSIANVSSTLFFRNGARGGRGGVVNGEGGNGQGGAVYNGADSTTTLVRSLVFANWARGAEGDSGGLDGLGQGGGLFNDDNGLFEVDALTPFRTRFNAASDDGDNVFGALTLL